MPARTDVAAAAPLWVRQQVDAPQRRARILHSGSHAVYVAVTDGTARRCVGLLSARSTFVPCGMRTTGPDLSALLAGDEVPPPGAEVSIGGGTLEIGSTSIRIGRTVDAAAPSLDASAAGAMADLLRSVLAGREAAVRTELSSTSLALLQGGDPAAVALLLGRGSGLTPVGDDVLSGWLAVTGAARPGPCSVALEVTATAERATTLLSATLLDRACAGDVLPEFRRLLMHLRGHRGEDAPGRLDTSVERVLSIGHTSGTGMLLGCLIALDHLKQTPPTARNR